jgi:dehydrogenase/reductase SDR family member 1
MLYNARGLWCDTIHASILRKGADMQPLNGKVAIVTGASRGVGKGIALGLGEAGATVYVTGRTIENGKVDEDLPGTVIQTAEQVTGLGGKGIGVWCDHRNDGEVESLLRRVLGPNAQIDIIVSNVWGGYEFIVEQNGEYTWENSFWEQPRWRWDAMFQAGVRSHFMASAVVAKTMVAQHSGLIVNISYWAGQRYMSNVIYGVAKAADDRMAIDMAHELKAYHVAVISLYPGLVRTERVVKASEHYDLGNSESPQFIGRAIAALAADPHIMQKSGQVLVAADLALEYGFTDIDGKQPRPLTLDTA